MLKNPYKNINWETVTKLQGNTHNHLFYQWHVDNAADNGMRFMGAHAHHGQPLYPMSEHDMVLPEGVIEYALAEHYGNTTAPHPAHFAGIGSTLVSDTEAPHSGYDGTIFEFLDAVRNTLQVSDGGGVHWNHPGAGIVTPGNPNLAIMKQAYDYAPDIFLGVEFYNNSQGKTYEGKDPWMMGFWDRLLESGRHVWGFANPDYEARRLEPYPDWEGKMILLIPELTRDACLRAIRNGEFFLVLYNNGFYFNNISSFENTVNVNLSELGDIKFKTATREVEFLNVDSANLDITASDIYVRVEAKKGEEQIFSQALMYVKTEEELYKGNKLVNNRSILV